MIESIYSPRKNSVPYIIEERRNPAQTIDIYSRLIEDRIIYMGEDFDNDSCNRIIAQLLYLDSINHDPIRIYINSPGGSVIDGLAVIDTINFIESPVYTICIGLAASMGAVLLSCGEKGHRTVLPHSRVMIHQVSGFTGGPLADMKIDLEQTRKCEQDIYTILSKNLDKSYEEIEVLCDRNNWFTGQEAVDLGIADKVLTTNKLKN